MTWMMPLRDSMSVDRMVAPLTWKSPSLMPKFTGCPLIVLADLALRASPAKIAPEKAW